MRHYGVEEEAIVFLMIRLRGGARTMQSARRPTLPLLCDDPEMVSELQAHAQAIRELVERANVISATVNLGYPNQIHQNMIDLKSNHADKIIMIVAESCLCDRFKQELFIDKSNYVIGFQLHQKVMEAAKKTKNSVNLNDVNELDDVLRGMCTMYTRDNVSDDEDMEDE